MTTKRVIFADPERCPACGVRGRIVESRLGHGYRKRRRQCPTCAVTWTSYESRINVQRAMARKRREILAADLPPPDVPATASRTTPTAVDALGIRPSRPARVGRSQYLTR